MESSRIQSAPVIVAGAGMSGLNAALQLNDAGVDVLVLEGANRIGGRVHTLDLGQGPEEAGATTYGPTHLRGPKLLERFKIETTVFSEAVKRSYGIRASVNF